MISLATIFLPLLRLPINRRRPALRKPRRRQATIDLVNASPHLRRDIGLSEDRFPRRGR